LNNKTGSGNVFLGSYAGFTETGSNKLYIDNSTITTPLIYGDFATNELTVNGKMRIGSMGSSSYRLYVNGSSYATGSWVSSDKRYKEDIQNVDSALDKIKQIEGVSYKFKQKEVNGLNFSELKGKTHIGLIAQDLEKVLPELVQKDENGYYAVNYDGLIPVLVEGIKAQQTVIEDQTTKIAEQAQEMTSLKTQVAALTDLVKELVDKNEDSIDTTDNGESTIQNKVSADSKIISQSTAVLKQNIPNPFSDQTTIEYELPSGTSKALLTIYDVSGQEIQSFNITGKGSLDIDSSNLENGTYIYTILVNGQSIASQKMIIQR